MVTARYGRLHIFALSSFAIAQPLYDLIGRNAEFLVAHRAGPWTIAGLVAVVSVLIPLILVAIVEAARLVRPSIASWVHISLVGCLSGLVAAGALRQVAPPVAFGLAAIVAIVVAWAYQAQVVRTFLTVVSPAIVVFPLVFVTATPVSRLVRPSGTHGGGGAFARQPPIVVVVFDELDTLALLDADGNIDENRFPNFAGLARTATWFPNAMAAFPYTPYAIPAIASGQRTDASQKKLPIAADYPDTLFTWLASTYRLHVAEPITVLCPPALCRAADTGAFARARALASDLAVLYLHLVTPQDIATARLPSLAFAWKGFGAAPLPRESSAPTTDSIPDETFERAAEIPRDELFRRWVREIAPAREPPTLHFIHSLLPHEPYQYLPSGRIYSSGGLTAGLSPDWSWTSSQAVVETGRLRHAAQVRFVDTLLGELTAHLKAIDLFDPALLVITSDHGAAFRAGDSHRGLTPTNYTEILPAPMFVKLPAQRNGRISERRVSGIDIVPTIAEVLGAELPWRTDGHPMFAESFPPRPALEYAGLGLPPLAAFDVREEARQVNARLRDWRRQIRHEALIGRPLATLDISPARSGVQVLSNDLRAFESVTADGRFLPALVEGRIEYDRPVSKPVPVALAVNGIVRAVTETAPWGGSPHYFTAFLDEYPAQPGANQLEVLAGDPAAPDRRFTVASSDLAAGVALRAGAAGEYLETGGGRRFPVESHVVGFVDRIDGEPDGITLHGWAVDRKNARQLRAVAVMSGDSSIAFAFPADTRPDVAQALALPPSTRVSYSVKIPRDGPADGALRLFGIATDGRAGELAWSEQARQVAARVKNAPAR